MSGERLERPGAICVNLRYMRILLGGRGIEHPASSIEIRAGGRSWRSRFYSANASLRLCVFARGGGRTALRFFRVGGWIWEIWVICGQDGWVGDRASSIERRVTRKKKPRPKAGLEVTRRKARRCSRPLRWRTGTCPRCRKGRVRRPGSPRSGTGGAATNWCRRRTSPTDRRRRGCCRCPS